MKLIQNTTLHPRTALLVEPFGDDGALRFVPVEGESLLRPFILDGEAVRELAVEIERSKP